MTTLQLDLPTNIDEKTIRGIEAIARAFEDVRSGVLTCPCTECELRKITEEASLD